jgi:hypothetical protein
MKIISLFIVAQIIAGTPEDKMLRRITAETAPDSKLQMVTDFEKQFPDSRALTDVYLMAIDVYRQKNDRPRIIEYGEKILKLEATNITALMVVSRNYALDAKNLDRAVQLAQRALDQVGRMKTQPAPASMTDSQWKEYIANTDRAARDIFEYAKALNAAAH